MPVDDRVRSGLVKAVAEHRVDSVTALEEVERMATTQRNRNRVLTIAGAVAALLVGIVLVVSVTGSLDSQAEPVPATETGETTEVPDDVQALLDAWASSWDQGDLRAVKAVVADDGFVYGRDPEDGSLLQGLEYLVTNGLMAQYDVSWRGPVVVSQDMGAAISRGERAYDLVGEVALTDPEGDLVVNSVHYLHAVEDDTGALKVTYATILDHAGMRKAGLGASLR